MYCSRFPWCGWRGVLCALREDSSVSSEKEDTPGAKNGRGKEFLLGLWVFFSHRCLQAIALHRQAETSRKHEVASRGKRCSMFSSNVSSLKRLRSSTGIEPQYARSPYSISFSVAICRTRGTVAIGKTCRVSPETPEQEEQVRMFFKEALKRWWIFGVPHEQHCFDPMVFGEFAHGMLLDCDCGRNPKSGSRLGGNEGPCSTVVRLKCNHARGVPSDHSVYAIFPLTFLSLFHSSLFLFFLFWCATFAFTEPRGNRRIGLCAVLRLFVMTRPCFALVSCVTFS